jgi:hypothetical protein
MNSLRSLFSIAVATLLVGAAAHAQGTYSMTGKAATGSGAFVDLPALGNAPCPSVTGKIGFASMIVQPKTAMLIGPVVHNPGGCIPGGPKVVAVNGTGGFTFPVDFFNQPFPGGTMGGTAADLQVTPVPNVPVILQLATSFKFEGPLVAPVTMNPVNNTKAPAVWRKFRHGAWSTQTGRLASTFTACAAADGMPADIDCTYPASGLVPAILVNKGGAAGATTGFGGTMALMLTTSPTQSSSLAIAIGGGKVQFNLVGGMGSRAAGRGYADYDTDALKGGDKWPMYVLTTMVAPPNNVIAMVTGAAGMTMTPTGMGPDGTNKNWGFPFTTGDIIARGTGSNGFGGANGQTVTAMGTDKITSMLPDVKTAMGMTVPVKSAMGAPNGRLLQLVAGGVAQSNIQGPNGTPNYTIVRLPEPARTLQLIGGAVALLAVAVWRGRKAR